MAIIIFGLSPFAAFIVGLFSMIAAWALAGAKKRSAFAWVLLAFLFGPISVLLLACFPKVGEVASASAVSSPLTYRKCPFCVEEIRREAVKCKHCGSDVAPLPAVYVDPDSSSGTLLRIGSGPPPKGAHNWSDNEMIVGLIIAAVVALMFGLAWLFGKF